jgi:predicted O-methyltransferase YrrM
MLSIATRRPAAEIHAYIQEAIRDTTLNDYFQARMAMHPDAKTSPELKSPFGRRLGWYAIARAVKPRVIIETGVERGHGSLILCAALLRNKAAGHEGRYYGTDINPISGFLLGDVYASVGKIVYGDSIETLKAFPDSVNLFINDSDHSAEYEAAEYAVIASKLARDAVILGDNAHVTDKLAIFAQDTGRNFMFFKEEPEKHWYPGAGIGIAFPRY